MPLSDILTRIGAVAMIVSALWNFIVSAIWFLSLVWVLVGLLWLVPMALALLNVLVAIGLLVVGHNKASVVGPVLGFVISVCNFNIVGGLVDLVALGLMIGGYVARANERQAELAYP